MNPRQEPYEVIPHVRIRAGGRSQGRSLPRLNSDQRSEVSGQQDRRKFMNRKIFCLALSALLFAHSFPAAAQQPKKVPLIGYLAAGNPASESARAEAIRLALRELGHVEGQNIAIEYRYSLFT